MSRWLPWPFRDNRPRENGSLLDFSEVHATQVDFVYPTADRLHALDEMVNLGYFRGIVKLLDNIEAESPECAAFVAHMRLLSRQFQLDAMTGILRKARDERLVD